jgi:SAM-dependent methyltransferase
MLDYDLELRLHNEALRRAYGIRAEDRVLDVGCGAGQTTRDAARLASSGAVLGVDRSEAMIERARSLTREAGLRNVEYECADVERHAFPRERFDVAISRFGTMFFDDPVAAFANVRGALRSGGRLVMMVWQEHGRNEWATSIERALEPGGPSRARTPLAIQPFSLGAPEVVRRILDAAGFGGSTFEEVRVPVCYGASADDAFEFVSGFGFVQETLERLGAAEGGRALERLRVLMNEHARGDGVWFDSGAWIVVAQRR